MPRTHESTVPTARQYTCSCPTVLGLLLLILMLLLLMLPTMMVVVVPVVMARRSLPQWSHRPQIPQFLGEPALRGPQPRP
jgi:hypothetical protein